ncbi:MAG: hypothetical protein ABL993_00165, partial [Vicinamibacterales bacterium]
FDQLGAPTRREGGLKPDAAPDPLQPWQLFTLAGLIGATIVVFVSRGHTPAGIILLSLTIFSAAAIGIAAWRTFGPFAMRDEPESAQMLGGRTRAALEREKTLALRSIKELEFDRAMGKVSEKDFAEMGARLRVRAAGLMRQLDLATGYRGEIEKEIERRMQPASEPSVTRAPAGSRREPEPVRPGSVSTACSICYMGNDGDARFCKSCGARLGATV